MRVKARRVEGLDPRGTLADNAERIVRTRLDELEAFIPDALDPEQVERLHDMRIAAKRLRYVLEVTGPACFGAYARPALRRTKELQDLLGEIHDCDVQLPRVAELAGELREDDVRELRRRAAVAPDLDPVLATRLPSAAAWPGVLALDAYLRARRRLLHERFVALWTDLEREGFAARLAFAAGERPAETQQAGDHAAPAELPTTAQGGE